MYSCNPEGMASFSESGDSLMFFCNGKKIIDANPDPETTLLIYLRRKLGLTGAKQGCSDGGCGACTVMISTYDPAEQKITHRTVNACLASVCSVHGAAVTTVEGIGSVKTRLHPVQERIAKAHGTQCGFCTPGMVMSMYTLLRNHPEPTMDDIQTALGGNLCRCTGYRPILQGFKTFTKDGGCCSAGCQSEPDQQSLDLGGNKPAVLFDAGDFLEYDPSQDIIFPPALLIQSDVPKRPLCFRGKRVTWLRPQSLEELLSLKAVYPGAKLVAGYTETAIEVKFLDKVPALLISVTSVPELNVIEGTQDGLCVGASVCLSRVGDVIKEIVGNQQDHKTMAFSAMLESLHLFGATQIRNVVTIGSVIMGGNPTPDLIPLFLAAGCSIELISASTGSRTVRMDSEDFTGRGKDIEKPDEILKSIKIPLSLANEYIYGFKQSLRRDFDGAVVNAGMRVAFQDRSDVVCDIVLAYGGVAETPALASKTMSQLKGRKWDRSLLDIALNTLAEEKAVPAGSPGGMETYRASLVLSFFFRFYLNVREQLDKKEMREHKPDEWGRDGSGTSSMKPLPFKATQVFQKVAATQASHDPVGRPVKHKAALQHATGEAIFTDDIPSVADELYMSIVYGRKPRARILSVDPTEALATEGVHHFICAKDIPGDNSIGMIGEGEDEELFATEEIYHACQPIGLILADTQTLARRAAQLVQIEYEELDAIITIEDAIEKKSFLDYTRVMQYGNLQEAFEKSALIVEGEVKLGGQEHFYLENHCALAIPREDGEMEIFSSNQDPTQAQEIISQMLCVEANRITSRVKRMGGAFGGKETIASLFAAMCAVAAKKVSRPVRFMLDRDEDMMTSGKRHPFLGRYRVGCSMDGRLQAADIHLFSNAGFNHDVSISVMNVAINHFDSCYKCPVLRLEGKVCRTNIQASTAMRGFGAPQAMMVMESMLTDVAVKCGISNLQVREINFYKEGDVTHTNQKLDGFNALRCWDDCLETSGYTTRRENVDLFNRQNRWKKRGLAIIPTKFGVSLGPFHVLQGGALVHIYRDGSVLVTHGGTEMGQGLHTKIIQLAARTLGVSEERIYLSDTSTCKVPNTTVTAGSTGTDINGGAVRDACMTLLQRLQPYMHASPRANWNEWVQMAYRDMVSLSSTGFFKVPDLTYDRDKNEGKMFLYYCYGVAVSEVEIDCLTGDHRILKTDIVMDVGDSVNPAIDIGQIEGAFVQGYGLFMLEDLRWSPNGHLLTSGPRTYKIPAIGNIPAEFNVTLLKHARTSQGICSAKSMGEAPLALASSVFFAIKDAIMSARADEGLTGAFRLDSPAVAERIRLACVDQFTERVSSFEPRTAEPFFVRP